MTMLEFALPLPMVNASVVLVLRASQTTSPEQLGERP